MGGEYLHDIGNLCLISNSKNSELSNYSPFAKTEHYYKAGYDSLKQKIMMEVVKNNKNADNQNKWWTDEIVEHHGYIENIVLSSFDELGTGQ